jgi:hypothetical protein
MKTRAVLCLSLSVLFLCACEDFGYVEKAKYDQLVQENTELKKQLAEKEEEIRSVPHHHYSLHQEGFRTFRFDADTGQTCITLTTESDWKNPKVKMQSCDCVDLLAPDSDSSNADLRKLYCGF